MVLSWKGTNRLLEENIQSRIDPTTYGQYFFKMYRQFSVEDFAFSINSAGIINIHIKIPLQFIPHMAPETSTRKHGRKSCDDKLGKKFWWH